jgi:Tol biopolymer transport system component
MTVFTSFTAAALLLLPALPATLVAQRSAASPGSFRTLATFELESPAPEPHVSPDGRFVLLGKANELLVYELTSKRTRKLADARGVDMLEWSRKGDRIAWVQVGDDDRTNYVWTMPVDPKTAVPSGPAQRVTPGPATQPAISLDGRWIAYAAPDSIQPGTTSAFRNQRLSVVPITGGPERVLAHFEGGFDYARWSADGKSIYVNGTVVGGKRAVVTKIYLNDRQPEVIRPENAEWLAGMTADRRHLVLVPARARIALGDRAIVIDTTGREVGRVQLPPGTVNEYDDVLGDSALVWVALKERKSIEIGSMDGGPVKRIPIVGESNQSANWSSDGKQLVFQVKEGSRTVIALMNADGSNVRVFRDHPMSEEIWIARWSPDSKYIAVTGRDWPRPMLIDVATGTFRSVSQDTTFRVGNWVWKGDSRSIVGVMLRGPSTPVSIDELTLGGERRKLLDIAALPGRRAFEFISDSTAFARSDSAAFVVSLRSGSVRKLGDVPATTNLRGMAISRDGHVIVGRLLDSRGPGIQQLEVTSLVSGERRLIEVPFRFAFAGPGFRLTPDGRSVVALGYPKSESFGTGTRLFVVPLDGGVPRILKTLKRPVAPGISISPDGRSIAYPVQEERSTSLLLVDLRPAFSQRASSRP